MTRHIFSWIGGIIILTTSSLWAANDVSLLDVETHGNFHSGGVIAEISGDDNRNSVAS